MFKRLFWFVLLATLLSPWQTATAIFLYGDPLEPLQLQVQLGLPMTYLHFNRVEGLAVGSEVRVLNLGVPGVNLFAGVSRGFSAGLWRHQVGGEIYFWRRRLRLGLSHADLTVTEDRWLMPAVENLLMTLLAKKDYWDYQGRSGVTLIGAYQGAQGMVSLAYQRYRRSSMAKATDWSLFGEGSFRDNPPVDAGSERGIEAVIRFKKGGSVTSPYNSWVTTGQYRQRGSVFGGDFDFWRVRWEIKCYQKLLFGHRFVARGVVGVGSARTPEQDLFDLGGISTLRGYPFKALSGNRMVLVSLDYFIGQAFIPHRRALLLRRTEMVLFADLGRAWFSPDYVGAGRGFRVPPTEIGLADLKPNVGIGIDHIVRVVRFNIAQRLDGKGFAPVFSVRLRRRL